MTTSLIYHVLGRNVKVGNSCGKVKHSSSSVWFQNRCQLAKNEKILRQCCEGDLEQTIIVTFFLLQDLEQVWLEFGQNYDQVYEQGVFYLQRINKP